MVSIKTNLETQNQLGLNKTCRKCGQDKPATTEYFFKNAGGKYGLTPRCKPCVNEDNKKWAAANPDRVRENANKRSQKYYHSDIERGRKIAREAAQRARANPKKYAVIQARKRGGRAGLKPAAIEFIRQSQNNLCAICQEPDPTDLDHCHSTGAVRWLLCKHCNRGLGAFRDRPDLMRKAADMLEKT